MSILRNSLAKGNEDIRSAISSSKFDKAKTFDKISTMILQSCERNISNEQIEKVSCI